MRRIEEAIHGLDANALNDAGWSFLDAWSEFTDQRMTGQTWNHIKPMVASAIKTYLEKTSGANHAL